MTYEECMLSVYHAEWLWKVEQTRAGHVDHQDSFLRWLDNYPALAAQSRLDLEVSASLDSWLAWDYADNEIRKAAAELLFRGLVKTQEVKVTKIAYNACFGGFSLSGEAIRLGRELSGNPFWCEATLKGETYPDSDKVSTDTWDSYHPYGDVPRHDPVLVAVIEQLGDRASGGCADLRIRELPSGMRYRIDEYDGNESVMTVDDYEWEVAP